MSRSPATTYIIPDRATRRRIAAFAYCEERTIKRFLSGERNPPPAIRRAIVSTMIDMGMPLPPAVKP